jgi:hypothetical protein
VPPGCLLENRYSVAGSDEHKKTGCSAWVACVQLILGSSASNEEVSPTWVAPQAFQQYWIVVIQPT